MADGGHTFVKKTFHKPTYCHHCSDLLWGLIGQGYICEVCNFIIHERCVLSVVTPCSGIAPCIIKNPVAHCWSEPTHSKRKFCTVCRKRLDETPAVHCLICEYFAHIECQDFAVPDCTENATYVPGKELLNVKHQHHWREGNLPATSKCASCKKTCWSSECLTGYRCEWCGMTTHGGCRMYLPTECNFGILQPIYLPPHSVSIPRTEVPIEAIIGVQVKSKTTLVRDYSCPELRTIDCYETEHAASDDGSHLLTLRETLLLERQRRARIKHNFLFSITPSTNPPTSFPSIASIVEVPTTPSVTTTTTCTSSATTVIAADVAAAAAAPLSEEPAAKDDFTEMPINQEISENERLLSTVTATPTVHKYQKNLQKSSSASSSLHLFYSNIFRRIHDKRQHGRRKYLSSNTSNDEEEDIEVCCDISGGDISDDYEHHHLCGGNVDTAAPSLRRSSRDKSRGSVDTPTGGLGVGGKTTTSTRHNIGGSGGISDVDYHGDAETEILPHESFYETSDTGGDLTTTTTDDIDIDSSMNVVSSNLSYNSSNSNTSIDNRSSIDKHRNAHNIQLTTVAEQRSPTAKTPTATSDHNTIKLQSAAIVLCPPTKTGAGGSLSSEPNSSDCSSASPIPPVVPPLSLPPVTRSTSFQEPGVKPLITSKSNTPPQKLSSSSRNKKYARIFTRRRSKRSNSGATAATTSSKSGNNNCRSDYSLDAHSQNIEITIQDEDGNYQPYDENFYTLSSSSTHHHADDADDDDDDDEDEDNGESVGLRDSGDGGIYQQYLDNRLRTLSSGAVSDDISDGGSSQGRSQTSTNEHVFGRLMKRMRRLQIGWRKPRYNKRRARSISEEFSSGDAPRLKDEESCGKAESIPGGSGTGCGSGGSTHYRADSGHKSDKSDKDKEKKEKEREEKDIEMIKVFDGNNSLRRQLYRVIIVPRTYTLEQLLTAALRAFHITRDPMAFYLTDLYAVGMEDTALQDPNPVLNLTHIEGKRPAIYLRFHDKDKGFVRVYPGKLQCSLEEPYVSVPVDNTTIIKDLIRDALDKFGLQDNQIQDYRCSEVLLDRGVTERILSWNERPWDIMKQLGKDSIRQMELMRFYMQHKQDPHGPNIALFVGNLPPGLSQRNYEQILNKYLTDENRFITIGPIYYEYGSVVLTFEDAQRAVRAFYNLRETIIEDKKLLVMLLPNIEPHMVPSDVRPLLVFVNVKSGGCQGLELISSFRKLLNPYQVFDLDNGGPLPGLYVFRQITNYKILVCGGDGTIGWVLQCLDNVGQDSECSSPPCAIVPLGTGNDLARVLCWGSGYTGGEDPLNLLRDVIEAEEIRLDRWTVVFHPEDKPEEPALKPPSNTTGKKKKAHQAHLSQQTNQHHQLPAITSSDISGGGAQNEDNSQIFVMNNYFGIGIDADLCLDFHNAREENPNKFNSRLHNKGYYVKMGLRKIVGRKTVKDLHKELRLEVDGKVVELPPVEGIIILNILSWGSGANPWGPDKDDQFSTPNHYDGVLEIVGVTGVVHLGQIQSGIRTAMRIAQGGHIKIHLYSDMPVQVDGEPWVQSPGDVVVLKSALKATMLKKTKSKRRLTEPHISPAVMSLSATSTASAASLHGSTSTDHPQQQQQHKQNLSNTQAAPENGDRDKDPATMLKKNKLKMKRRNTEPTMVVAGSVMGPQMSLALQPPPAEGTAGDSNAENAPNNTDF